MADKKDTAVTPRDSKFQYLRKHFAANWQVYALLLPALLYFFIFNYVPMYGVQIAFKDYIANLGFWDSPWVGFEHFERFFNSYYFLRLIKNTLLLSLYQTILFPLPIIFALSLHELSYGKFKRWSQTLTYAPHFISVVVVVGMIIAFLDPITGIFNHIIEFFGGSSVNFLTSPKWFRHIFVWSEQWQSLGWGTIIYLAALAGVNPELLEAAKVDGASRMQRIWHINIPAILPTIVVLFILNMGSFMQIGFEKVLLLQNNLNSETSDIIATFVYETGILEGQYSFSTAVGLFESAINIVILVTANYLARKISDNSLW